MGPLAAALALLLIGCASVHESSAAAASAADPGTTEDAPCGRDDDCAFTRVAQGACCPMLCTPRVVTRKRATELEANLRSCTDGKPESCPHPVCRERGTSIAPACEAGRCVAHAVTPRGD